MGKEGWLWLEDQEVGMHGGLMLRHSCGGSLPGCGGMPPLKGAVHSYPHWMAWLVTVLRTVGLSSAKWMWTPLECEE